MGTYHESTPDISIKKERLFRIPNICLFASILIWSGSIIFPPVNWIARTQFRVQLGSSKMNDEATDIFGIRGTSNSNSSNKMASVGEAISKKMPNDLEIQVAVALIPYLGPGSKAYTTAADRLHRLLPMFPNSPDLLATTARYMTTNSFSIKREEVDAVNGMTTSTLNRPKPESPSDVILHKLSAEHLLEVANLGTKIDPDNAVFHMYAAAALISLRRDEESFRELGLAARAKRWDEYFITEINGRERLYEIAFGDRQAFLRYSNLAVILFPQFAQYRATARVMAYLAGQKEKQGDKAGGIKIRKDLLSVGSMMRAESKVMIGNLVGNAISAIAGSHPNGYVTPKNNTQNGLARLAANQKRYIEMLLLAGEPKEAERFKQEYFAGQSMRAIESKYLGVSMFGAVDIVQIAASWIACLIILANLSWCLIIIAFLAIIQWRRRVRASHGVRQDDPFTYAVLALVVAMLGVILFKGQSGSVFNYLQVTSVISSMNGASGVNPAAESLARALTFAMGLTIPAIILIGTLLYAAIRRRDFGHRFLRGSANALSIASLLISMFYTFGIFMTSKAEEDAAIKYTQSNRHEGLYAAKIVKMPWPARIMPQ